MLRRLAVRHVQAARHTVAVLGELTPAFTAFLTPLATMAFALGVWALCAQLAVASNFPIQKGLLADWRVWMLIAVGLEAAAVRFGPERERE
jgi:hypothetical protein